MLVIKVTVNETNVPVKAKILRRDFKKQKESSYMLSINISTMAQKGQM